MGCDGGTIPTRDELVRTRKKPEKKDRTAELDAKWKHCALSQEPLVPPIMACELGRLYNKESTLELLLDRTKFDCAASFDHLKSLKDLRQLNLTTNRGYTGGKAEMGNCYIDTQTSVYICPVAGLEMNGTYKFCFPWSCGCVISERALKEVPTEVCHTCGEKFMQDDIIVLNPPEEDLDTVRLQMEARRLRLKRDKKLRKAQKHTIADIIIDSVAEDGPTTSKRVRFTQSAGQKNKLVTGTSASRPNGMDTRLEHKSKPTNGKAEDKSTKSTGIQEDPTTSTVYKSLFTSSDKAKNQQKAHWVTFNPMYY
ncbi:replication termination factor 2-like isoform X2 [Gigantopelta aegis]|uniref:replication termination factor 2-like isoform X2 n=2 Tax=Gigantopelta aegis TaxID=1735272 RepID=UPI001B88C90F|nr:replication termination factor 2-like isoform X2 [Gigantopelta aegis]